ncbi:hypothetical protein PLICRDRAFT_47989 [Plicaturopsis crispa FD-325 SS-3]|nr:hypothetical protein PLICRDRAFT_47989 [Plicaturopsis crispa FD-325 SS-3]
MSTHASQVTIALLPVSLGLVHVPRSRLAQLSHPVLRQILEPKPTFLNVTCNEIELSLFAEHSLLSDFEPIARRDRQRRRSRSGSVAGAQRKHTATSSVEPVEISYDRWNVLQIDSHSDQLDNSGARVHELSAPLAAAGISILYQSSYMSDFIFVKETRLQEVMTLLGSAGFDLYSSDPSQLTSRVVSPILSPTSTDDSSSVLDLSTDFTPEAGAVLTRTRSNTDASITSLTSVMKQLCADDNVKDGLEPSSVDSTETVNDPHTTSARSKSHSPTSGEVHVLSPDLTCVGLTDDDADNWGLKIVKLVAYPELLPSRGATQPSSLYSKFGDLTTHQISILSDPHSGAEIAYNNRGRHPADTVSTSDESSSASSEEDGYFSHSPPGNLSTSSLPSSASRSYPDLTKSTTTMSPSFKPATKRLIAPLSPIEVRPRPALNHLETPLPVNAERRGSQSRVPFFSFTRTSEGSSLTTDVTLLAALFPPAERHMVICGGELDAVDDRSGPFQSPDFSDEEDEDEASQGSTLKCLQIDLRRFGLDKHGLVNRFSRVLEESGINHMYSSTFKTANLLVDKRHAVRAQALLRAC